MTWLVQETTPVILNFGWRGERQGLGGLDYAQAM
jgi:hypothetical protein